MDPFSTLSTTLSLAPVPYLSVVATLLIQVLTPRTLEENILLFRTRSQHIGSLSSVSAFLAAVQGQFISLTYQRNGTPVQKAANICFFLGVSLNVMGAATGLIGASSLPNQTSLQEDLAAYQKAIDEAEGVFEASGISDAESPSNLKPNIDELKIWGRTHHRHVTYMFLTGNLIARWNTQSFIYALVMLGGVAVFFLGLIFFILDTQPRVVWLTILLTSCITYFLIQGVQAICGYLVSRGLRSPLRDCMAPHDYLAEERKSKKAMRRRERMLSVAYNAYRRSV